MVACRLLEERRGRSDRRRPDDFGFPQGSVGWQGSLGRRGFRPAAPTACARPFRQAPQASHAGPDLLVLAVAPLVSLAMGAAHRSARDGYRCSRQGLTAQGQASGLRSCCRDRRLPRVPCHQAPAACSWAVRWDGSRRTSHPCGDSACGPPQGGFPGDSESG